MTFCKRCRVKLRGGSDTCILCGSKTHADGGVVVREYPEIKFSNRIRYIVRILALLSVVVVALSLYIDYRFDSDTIWSFIVLGATIYCWTAFLTRKSRKNIGLMIFIQLIAVSFLGFVVDLSTGNHGWMINYVIPFMIIAAQGIITSVMIARPMLFRDFILYELQIAVMGMLSIFLMVFGLATVHWSYITVCVYSAVILVGTLLLGDRRTKQEMVKRFHF